MKVWFIWLQNFENNINRPLGSMATIAYIRRKGTRMDRWRKGQTDEHGQFDSPIDADQVLSNLNYDIIYEPNKFHQMLL